MLISLYVGRENDSVFISVTYGAQCLVLILLSRQWVFSGYQIKFMSSKMIFLHFLRHIPREPYKCCGIHLFGNCSRFCNLVMFMNYVSYWFSRSTVKIAYSFDVIADWSKLYINANY